MYDIKVSLDNVRYKSKPDYYEAPKINKRIAESSTVLNCPVSIHDFVRDVGEHGQTFCPAVFKDGVKSKENIKEIQMLALDFDGKGNEKITPKKAAERARKYNVEPLFAYHTFSSNTFSSDMSSSSTYTSNTFSGDWDRFRMVFLNDMPIKNVKAAEIQQNMLLTIFPEADQTGKDVSKMYYGGKGLFGYNANIPKLELESLAMDMYRYLKDRHGETNYKRHIAKFAKENGIALDRNGFLDIEVIDDSALSSVNEKPAEITVMESTAGAASATETQAYVKPVKSTTTSKSATTEFAATESPPVDTIPIQSNLPKKSSTQNDKNSPSTIILSRHGEKLSHTSNLPTHLNPSNRTYRINLDHGKGRCPDSLYAGKTAGKVADNATHKTTVNIAHNTTDNIEHRNTDNIADKTTDTTTDKTPSKPHAPYRSDTLKLLSPSCRLCREFEEGTWKLNYNQLRGIGTNIIKIEAGPKWFLDILNKHSKKYSITANYGRWEYFLKGFKRKNYNPSSCANFCPYKDSCNHGTNILSTVKPKPKQIERLVNHDEQYCTIEEAEEDFRRNFHRALRASDTHKHIIKAQTALGKTTEYLNYMADNPCEMFLVAVPTNKLKHEVLIIAILMGIDVMETPSLEEIKHEMPPDVWEHIQSLYNAGRHRAVHPYVRKVAGEQDIPCLNEYLKQLKKFESFGGCVITTHKKILCLREETLKKYSAVIVDEDIIFKGIVTNQGQVTVSDLKKLSKATDDIQLSRKIKKLLKHIETKSFFTLPQIEWDDTECGEDNGRSGCGKKGGKGSGIKATRDNNTDGTSPTVDIPSFCMAEHFCFRKASKEENLDEDTIFFLNPVTFRDIKYIIVSATVDEKVCRYYFGERKVKFYECRKARITGTLNQYPDKSYSRSSIDNNPGIIERIKSSLGIENLITFKKYHMGSLWFGNCDGCDVLAGQDLIVIGTPYHAEFIYKLFAFTLRLDFDKNAEMKYTTVTHNGYKFRFKTYDDEVLRNIHLWMIESDLEQAVGRARLLRRDCIVYLFSNFPLGQAKFLEFVCDGEHKDVSSDLQIADNGDGKVPKEGVKYKEEANKHKAGSENKLNHPHLKARF